MTDLWQRLADHRAATRDRPIAALFDADPDRARRCAVAADGLWFDWSKTAIDDRAHELLLALAESVPARRKAMFSGEKINETEGRAVLHTALRATRGPILVDGRDVLPEVHATLDRSTHSVSQQFGARYKAEVTDLGNDLLEPR